MGWPLGRLVRCPTSQEVLKTALADPFGTRQMALPDAPSPLQLFVRINLQDNFHDLSAVGTFGVGVEQAQIDHEVLLIVARPKRLVRCGVGNVG